MTEDLVLEQHPNSTTINNDKSHVSSKKCCAERHTKNETRGSRAKRVGGLGCKTTK